MSQLYSPLQSFSPIQRSSQFGNFPPTQRSSTPLSNPNRIRTYQQWLTIAGEKTIDIRTNGSPTPLAWVLVEGKAIPANAIVAGNECDEPLYIARAFCEGSIYLGKAGRHIPSGAVIIYKGRERQVSAYEVLVSALAPLRWGTTPSVTEPIPAFPSPRRPELRSLGSSLGPELLNLQRVKTIVLIDDTLSMFMDESRWQYTKQALANVADSCQILGTEGFDMFFLNDHHSDLKVTSSATVRMTFDSIEAQGSRSMPRGAQTPIGQKLKWILNKYLHTIERQSQSKPLNIVIMADGAPTDDPKEAIYEAAKRLERTNTPTQQLRIRFIQIGDDVNATRALRELDDLLPWIPGAKDIMETMLYNPSAPRLTPDLLARMISGGEMGSKYGSESPNIARRASPMSMPFGPSPPTPRSYGMNLNRSDEPLSQGLGLMNFGSNYQGNKVNQQWLASAQQSTREYLRNGSPVPYAWVLVEGRDIPPNAVVGGNDNQQSLYIARASIEGNICLGQAGRHLRSGCGINFKGNEIEVSSYEVLVSGSPISWSMFPLAVVIPDAGFNFDRLCEIKMVVLVDDSISMTADTRWPDAGDALAEIADLAAQHNADGMDVYFLNDSKFGHNIKSGNEVNKLFGSIDMHGSDAFMKKGQTPTGKKLKEVLDYYVPMIIENPDQKPISIVVITDGEPTDEPENVIIETAQILDTMHVPLRQLRIQFVQIGDEPLAAQALKELDDDLSSKYNIRDMVDTAVYDQNEPRMTSLRLVNVLFGFLDRANNKA